MWSSEPPHLAVSEALYECRPSQLLLCGRSLTPAGLEPRLALRIDGSGVGWSATRTPRLCAPQ